MADSMTFPDTVEEFMEQYKVVDTEQVYTNGTEFVPIYRMKQWFEHLSSVQPTYTDEQIQKMQDLHQAEIEKAFELGREDAKAEIIHCKDCKWFEDIGCAIEIVDESDKPTENDFCSYAERKAQ